MQNEVISTQYIVLIVTAIITGSFARAYTLREDYRQYPSYPNGYLIHLITGFVAASLGAVAIPALMSKNFVAVTFLSLAIQQFREVRKMEFNSLLNLEQTEYTRRGSAYIDGIAKTFEARNYIALTVAFTTALTIQLVNSKVIWLNVISGIISGIAVLLILTKVSKGKTVGDIAKVKPGKIEVRGSELYVDGLFVTNLLGTELSRKMFQEEGIAVVIHPNEEHYRITLDNYGLRQAVLFEATRAVGIKRYHFTRKDFSEGRIITALVPIIQDVDRVIVAVEKTPLIESVKKSHALMKTRI
ncbi:MAG: YIEGIA domain-containing protein [Peptococcales bacterium]|jgi:hypothetical protein